MEQDFMNLLSARHGHFRYESGYHSDLWLDLDLLFLRPSAVYPFVLRLAEKLARHGINSVCGPLTGGGLIAQTIALELGIEFFFTERLVRPQDDGLYPVEYRLPSALQREIAGKHLAIVDDVISAGSAVRGTLADVEACGARAVVVGALLVLGDSAEAYFGQRRIPVEAVVRRPNNLWLPSECPLCAEGVPLEDVTADASRFPPRAGTQ